MSSSKTRVTVTVEDGQGELEIVDSDFRVIERGFGTLKSELNPGIYKARARAGDVRREELFVVEPDVPTFEMAMEPLYFSSPLPLNATSTIHKFQRHALVTATGAPVDAGLGQGATLLLSIRDSSDACFQQSEKSPIVRDNYRGSFTGFRLRNWQGDMLLDFDQAMQLKPDFGIALVNLHLHPGNYVLSYERDVCEQIAMPLPSLRDWQTQVFLHVDLPQGLDAPGLPNLADRAVMMAPMGIPFYPDRHLRLAEFARYALMQGRPALPSEQVEEMLKEELHNPVLSLLAAHMLLLKRHPPHELLHAVTDNLAHLIGPNFPDVVALRIVLAELDKAAPKVPSLELSSPPLLRSSCDIVARYSELLGAGSLVCKIASRLVPQGPWLAWKPAASIGWKPAASKKNPLMLDMIRSSAQFLFQNEQALSLKSLDKLEKLMQEFNTLLASEASDSRPLPLPTASIDTEPSVAKTTLSPEDDASVALKAIITLAQQIPWDEFIKLLESEAIHRHLLTKLTTLQTSLLPTLQLIYSQLEQGGDFTLDKLEELCKGLNVPVSVLRESVEDLVTLIVRSDMEILLEKIEEKYF